MDDLDYFVNVTLADQDRFAVIGGWRYKVDQQGYSTGMIAAVTGTAPTPGFGKGNFGSIKQIFNSIRASGQVPAGWKSISQVKVIVKNKALLKELRKVLPGQWKKVYDKGVDGTEIHYFQHSSGKVFNVKIK